MEDLQTMHNNHFFILTGGPGVGKTSVLEALQDCDHNFHCVKEGARDIIKKQMDANGDALPWKNKEQYKSLMLKQSVQDYIEADEQQVTFFDRGIPDTLAYARLEGLTINEDLQFYSHYYRYNTLVFIFPPWKEIYETDTERKQQFSEVVETHNIMLQTYMDCGYKPMVMPKTTITSRCQFILDTISHDRVKIILKSLTQGCHKQ